MEFQRGGNIKETIKVGLSAGSYEIFGLEIRVGFSVLEKDHNKQIVFDIKDGKLESFLQMLDSEGLNLKFHQRIMELSIEKFIDGGNIPRFFDMENPHLIAANFSVLPYGKAKKEKFNYAEKLSIPRLFGKIVIYRGKLYEIKDDTENPGYWNE
jgi:hypothetical protein